MCVRGPFGNAGAPSRTPPPQPNVAPQGERFAAPPIGRPPRHRKRFNAAADCGGRRRGSSRRRFPFPAFPPSAARGNTSGLRRSGRVAGAAGRRDRTGVGTGARVLPPTPVGGEERPRRLAAPGPWAGQRRPRAKRCGPFPAEPSRPEAATFRRATTAARTTALFFVLSLFYGEEAGPTRGAERPVMIRPLERPRSDRRLFASVAARLTSRPMPRKAFGRIPSGACRRETATGAAAPRGPARPRRKAKAEPQAEAKPDPEAAQAQRQGHRTKKADKKADRTRPDDKAKKKKQRGSEAAGAADRPRGAATSGSGLQSNNRPDVGQDDRMARLASGDGSDRPGTFGTSAVPCGANRRTGPSAGKRNQRRPWLRRDLSNTRTESAAVGWIACGP